MGGRVRLEVDTPPVVPLIDMLFDEIPVQIVPHKLHLTHYVRRASERTSIMMIPVPCATDPTDSTDAADTATSRRVDEESGVERKRR